MRILRGQWPLILVLIALFAVGLWLVLSAGETPRNVTFNLGIELTGTAISVFLIELMVSQYIEGREASRRRPLLSIVVRRLAELVAKAVEELKLIGIDVDASFTSAEQLVQSLTSDQLNEQIAPSPDAPQHRISKALLFETRGSWTKKYLHELYDIVRFDLPPEIASAILAVICMDTQLWTTLVPPAQGVDTNWIADRRQVLFTHYTAVKELRKQLCQLRTELGDSR